MNDDADRQGDFEAAVQERMSALDVDYATIARETGVHSSQVSRICRGKFKTCSENVVQVCIYLGVAPPRVALPSIGGDSPTFNFGALVGTFSADEIDRVIKVLRLVREVVSGSERPQVRSRRFPR